MAQIDCMYLAWFHTLLVLLANDIIMISLFISGMLPASHGPQTQYPGQLMQYKQKFAFYIYTSDYIGNGVSLRQGDLSCLYNKKKSPVSDHKNK